MSFIQCNACNKKISASAAQCPHCGKRQKFPWLALLNVSTVLLIVALCVYLFIVENKKSDDPILWLLPKTDRYFYQKRQVIEHLNVDTQLTFEPFDSSESSYKHNHYNPYRAEVAVTNNGEKPIYNPVIFCELFVEDHGHLRRSNHVYDSIRPLETKSFEFSYSQSEYDRYGAEDVVCQVVDVDITDVGSPKHKDKNAKPSTKPKLAFLPESQGQ